VELEHQTPVVVVLELFQLIRLEIWATAAMAVQA
jgi:hypothetical protein